MIVCDITSVKTGRKKRSCSRLQRKVAFEDLKKPQYIGSPNHVLDLILRHLYYNYPTALKKNLKRTMILLMMF